MSSPPILVRAFDDSHTQDKQGGGPLAGGDWGMYGPAADAADREVIATTGRTPDGRKGSCGRISNKGENLNGT